MIHSISVVLSTSKLRFYVQLHTKKVISKTFFQPISWLSTEETKSKSINEQTTQEQNSLS